MSGKTAQLAGFKGGGYKPPCAERLLQTYNRALTINFFSKIFAAFGSLRKGLWCSLSLAAND